MTIATYSCNYQMPDSPAILFVHEIGIASVVREISSQRAGKWRTFLSFFFFDYFFRSFSDKDLYCMALELIVMYSIGFCHWRHIVILMK